MQRVPPLLQMNRSTSTMNSERSNSLKKYNHYLVCLTCCYMLALLSTVMLANRPVAFEFLWGTVHLPGGIFIFPFVYVVLDILTETYGPSVSRSLIVVGFVTEFLLSLFGIAVSHMGYPDHFSESHVEAYKLVFNSTLWFVISSCIANLLGELINNHYIFKWKLKYNGQWFVVRSIISMAIGQAVLTFLVDMLAFGYKYPLYELSLIMLHGYLWKMAFAALMVIPSWWFVKYLKSLGIDSYESSKISTNPFAMNSDK